MTVCIVWGVSLKKAECTEAGELKECVLVPGVLLDLGTLTVFCAAIWLLVELTASFLFLPSGNFLLFVNLYLVC